MGRKLTTQEFVIKARKIHGEKYDYSLTDYTTMFQPVKIICPVHGCFIQKAHDHIDNCGCLECGIIKRNSLLRKPVDKFIEQCKKQHGDFYDYSLIEYRRGTIPVQIVCPAHGAFYQSPNNHRRGARCPLCYNDLETRAGLIKRFREIHGDAYDYSLITQETIKSRDRIEIICPVHGIFEQMKRAHAQGQKCPACRSSNSASQKKWLDTFQNPNIVSPYKLLDLKLLVDGYDPATNTVYEFYGDFWHGNPQKFDSAKQHPLINKTFGQLYQKTKNRDKLIKKFKYKLVTIWESEWNKIKPK